jgi:hypothetical protein
MAALLNWRKKAKDAREMPVSALQIRYKKSNFSVVCNYIEG